MVLEPTFIFPPFINFECADYKLQFMLAKRKIYGSDRATTDVIVESQFQYLNLFKQFMLGAVVPGLRDCSL